MKRISIGGFSIMGLCDSPDKILRKKKRKRKTSRGTGRNASHRFRSSPSMEYAPLQVVIHQPEDDVHVINPDVPFPVGFKSKEMWDTHGYIQNWMNPCVKEKWDGGSNPIPPLYDADGPVVTFEGPTPNCRDLVRETIPFLDSAQLDELALRSEDRLSRVVPANVSLANFILELIQLCTGNIRGIQRFNDVYKAALKAYQEAYKRALKAGHKEASARWLAWNFAIKPALKDLQTILCSISAMYKKLKWLQDNNNKVVYLHYDRKLDDLLSYDPTEFVTGRPLVNILKADPNGAFPNGTFALAVRYTDVKLDYHAESKVFLSIPDKYLNGAKGMSILWGAMQGLHNPVGIIWEAIPFTWLIDYFLSYRARLWQWRLDYNPYDEGVEVLGYGHSFRAKAKGEMAVIHMQSSANYHTLGGFEYDIYCRREGLPFPTETTLFRLPSTWYHASIIGSLIIVKAKSTRRRKPSRNGDG